MSRGRQAGIWCDDDCIYFRGDGYSGTTVQEKFLSEDKREMEKAWSALISTVCKAIKNARKLQSERAVQ